MDVCSTMDSFLGTARKNAHTTRGLGEDIDLMVKVLVEKEVAVFQPQRKFERFKFENVRRRGLTKIESGWLRNYLDRQTHHRLVDSTSETGEHVVEDENDFIF